MGAESGGAYVFTVSASGRRPQGLARVGSVDSPGRPLSESLFSGWKDALLFRALATLRLDVPVFDTVDDLHWREPRASFEQFCARIEASDLVRRAAAVRF